MNHPPPKPPSPRDQFADEVETLVRQCHNRDYDAWSQAMDYDKLRVRARLLWDRLHRGQG